MSSMLRKINRERGVDCRAPAKVRRASGHCPGRRTAAEQANDVKNKRSSFLALPQMFARYNEVLNQRFK